MDRHTINIINYGTYIHRQGMHLYVGDINDIDKLFEVNCLFNGENIIYNNIIATKYNPCIGRMQVVGPKSRKGIRRKLNLLFTNINSVNAAIETLQDIKKEMEEYYRKER